MKLTQPASRLRGATTAWCGQMWHPAADVFRTRDGWLVRLELAGMSPENMRIDLVGRCLIVAGRRCDTRCRELMQCECHALEIQYDDFSRCIEFPAELAGAHVSTDYRDGMLTVRIRMEAASDE